MRLVNGQELAPGIEAAKERAYSQGGTPWYRLCSREPPAAPLEGRWMKTTTLATLGRAAASVGFAATTLFALTGTTADAARRVVLPSGTVIPVRLDREMSSKTARPGDRFTATVRTGNDDSGMPE